MPVVGTRVNSATFQEPQRVNPRAGGSTPGQDLRAAGRSRGVLGRECVNNHIILRLWILGGGFPFCQAVDTGKECSCATNRLSNVEEDAPLAVIIRYFLSFPARLSPWLAPPVLQEVDSRAVVTAVAALTRYLSAGARGSACWQPARRPTWREGLGGHDIAGVMHAGLSVRLGASSGSRTRYLLSSSPRRCTVPPADSSLLCTLKATAGHLQ